MNVLLAEPSVLMREALRLALQACGAHLAGAASDLDELLLLAGRLEADIVLVDWRLARAGGAAAVIAEVQAAAHTPVVLLALDPLGWEGVAVEGVPLPQVSKLLDPRELVERLRGLTGSAPGAPAAGSCQPGDPG